MAEKTVSTDSFATEAKQEYTGKKLRIALIGCGGISETHLKALQPMQEVSIVAGVDIKSDRLKLIEEKYGITDLYTDWKKMLKEVKPDACLVLTPNGLHCAPTLDALNGGAHVLVEKPMAMTPAECQKMIDTAKKNDKKLAVGFQYRYHPNTDYLVRSRDDGRFGNMMFVKCQALRRRGIPNWGVFGQKTLQGGGPMIDIGVHVIEMAHYLLGQPKPISASGNTWTYMGNKKNDTVSRWPDWDYKTYTVEDLAIGQIRFDNGAILHIEAMFCGHIEKDVWNFTMFGDKGGCQWDPPSIYTDRAGTQINETAAYVGDKTDFQTLFTFKLKNWISGCLNNTPLRAPGEAGMAVQKILDGVYRASEAGKEVAIK